MANGWTDSQFHLRRAESRTIGTFATKMQCCTGHLCDKIMSQSIQSAEQRCDHHSSMWPMHVKIYRWSLRVIDFLCPSTRSNDNHLVVGSAGDSPGWQASVARSGREQRHFCTKASGNVKACRERQSRRLRVPQAPSSQASSPVIAWSGRVGKYRKSTYIPCIWGFPKMVVPKNSWFITENPI